MIQYLLYPFSWLLRCFPNQIVLAIGDLLGSVTYLFFPFRKNVIEQNLRTAFGNKLGEAEISSLVKRNYQHYAKVLLEIIRSLSWSQKEYRSEIEILGKENLEEAIQKKTGGFILTSHLGNWEHSIQGAAADGLQIDVVVKKAKIEWIDRMMQWYRKKAGAGIFLESETAKDILKSLGQGRFVCVILDQFMGPPIGLPVSFFGQKAGTAVALALLTEKKDVPVISAYNFRGTDGKIRIVFEPALELKNLSEDRVERLYQKTQMFNDAMERNIRKYPEQWLWLHRRWKEYRGEPRWKRAPAFVGILALCLISLARCSSTGATPTGIALPSDPSIAVPKFDETKVDGEMGPSPTPTPSPNPVLSDIVKPAKKGKTKKEAKVTPPVTTPQPSPLPAENVFNIVPVDRIPFEVGEQLVMELGWTALPAGKAVIEVRNGPSFNGRETFHLWGNILSSKIVDTVYHVDNTIESFVDRQGIIPYKFLLHMVESKQLKETRVSFDHPNKKAFYWAKRISERWGNQDIDRQDALTPSARDMFSALYYARTINYQLGKKVAFGIYENGQNWNVEVTPVASELVHSGVGAFQCWKLSISVKLNNVLSPTGDLFLWVSDDSKKYPVKFDAKIKIGSMYGNLTSIRER